MKQYIETSMTVVLLLLASYATTSSQVQNQPRPEYVIIDKQEPAYTVFLGIPEGSPKEKEFEKIKSQTAEIKEVEI
jgi:hypothetical protein